MFARNTQKTAEIKSSGDENRKAFLKFKTYDPIIRNMKTYLRTRDPKERVELENNVDMLYSGEKKNLRGHMLRNGTNFGSLFNLV